MGERKRYDGEFNVGDRVKITQKPYGMACLTGYDIAVGDKAMIVWFDSWYNIFCLEVFDKIGNTKGHALVSSEFIAPVEFGE